MTEPHSQKFKVFLVEDNDDDVFVILKAISQSGVTVETEVAEHGEALLAALRERDEAHQTLPNIILLDINMPRLDGYEVIRALKADPRLCHIPVLFLTTTSRKEDVQRAFESGASSFFSKPADFEDLVRLMEHILIYWKRVTRLPGRD
ncbi:MAG: response regulator [Candidatus Hydrogenedentes bacterium]|nr:response regulator [Candidatus Hydrogenedentota bacterium]